MPRSSVLAFCAFLLVGCEAFTRWSGLDRPPPAPAVGDYSCLTLPSELEQPGVILSRPVSGGPTLLVVDLLRDPTTGQRNETNIVFREGPIEAVFAERRGAASFDWSIGVLNQVLAGIQPGLNINVSSNLRQSWPGKISFGDVRPSRTFASPVGDRARDWAMRTQRDPSLRYFLIRDALIASRATIELDRGFAATNQLSAAIELAGSAQVSTTLDVGATYRLVSPLQPPKTVCVVLDEITEFAAAAAAAPGAAPSLSGVTLVRTVVQDLTPAARTP